MKQIPNYPDYAVTVTGHVWSYKTKKWLSTTPQKSGHLSVMLTKDKEHSRQRVHRLVLEAHVGPCPEDMECRHLNGKCTDNRLENLKWGTRSENRQDSIRHGTHFTPSKEHYGEESCNSKLSNWDRCVILFEYLTGEFTQAELGREYGITDVAISHLVCGRTWPFVNIRSTMLG